MAPVPRAAAGGGRGRVRTGRHAPTPYIGPRERAETLRTMVEGAAAGHGGMVLIGGVAGVGKSRLVRETAAMAERLGMAVYTGNCLDMESPPPYQPTIDHLEQAARTDCPERISRRSRRQRARDREALAVTPPALRRHRALARPDARAGTSIHAPRRRRVHRARRPTTSRWCSPSRISTGPTSRRCCCCVTSVVEPRVFRCS